MPGTVRSIPHGTYSLIPTLLTTMGWMAALFQDGCDYVRLEGDVVRLIASDQAVPFLEVGRNAYREPEYDAHTDSWTVSYIGKCLIYPEELVNFDIYWRFAKGMAFASLVLGGSGALFLWFSFCCVFSKGTWRLAGILVLGAALFQCISFLWLRTELCTMGNSECSLFWGSKADIAAACFWFTASLSLLLYYPPPGDHLAFMDERNDGVVYDDDAATANMSVMSADPTDHMTEPMSYNGDVELPEEPKDFNRDIQQAGEDSRQVESGMQVKDEDDEGRSSAEIL